MAVYAFNYKKHIINCNGNIEAKTNAIRVEACVNVCNGIPTAVLQSNKKWMDNFYWAIEIMERCLEDWDNEIQDRIKRISKLLKPIYKEQICQDLVIHE